MNKSFSLAALEPPLQCIKCRTKPQQEFILLLCDHVLCAECVDSCQQLRKPGFDGLGCPCGLTTFFKSTSSKFEHQSYSRNSTRPSVGLIQSRSTGRSKQHMGKRVQTQFVSVDQEEPSRTHTLEKSSYPVEMAHFNDFTKDVNKQSSYGAKCSYPKIVHSYQLHKRRKNSLEINRSASHLADISDSQELTLELEYLKVRHSQLMQGLERAYYKAAKTISGRFEALENRLKDLCLERIIMEGNESQVDFGKVVKLRYDHEIGSQIASITESLNGLWRTSGSPLIPSKLQISRSHSREKQPPLASVNIQDGLLLKFSRQPNPSIASVYSKHKGMSRQEQSAWRHRKLRKGSGRRRNVIIEL